MGFIGSLRISKRVVKDYFNKAGRMKRGRTKILIIGAGSAGVQIGREMFNNRKSKYFPVGYIDDDPAKKGLNINGIKVLGTRKDIPAVLKGNGVDDVLVAIPSVRSKDIRQIVEIIRESAERGNIADYQCIQGLVSDIR
jgi:FlaA1/EpsC-like NDP-sugar epimerase